MDQEPRRGRGTLTTLFLGGGMAFIMFFFLNLVSLGVFFWVVASVFGIVLLGLVHYVLWGQAFSEEVAGEREEHQIKEHLHIEDRE